MNTDFHNHSLPGMDTGAQNAEQSRLMLGKLRELGFIRVFLTPCYDRSKEHSIRGFLKRRELALAEIAGAVPRGLKVFMGAEVILEEGIYSDKKLQLLALGKSRYILVSLPLRTGYPDWLDLELHKILYKSKLRPVFAGFERYFYIYPVDIYKKLMNIPGAVYQFNVNSLAQKQTIATILALFKKSKPIIFGTNAKNDLNRIPDTEPLSYLKNSCSMSDYNYLIIKSNNFIKYS